MWPFKKKIKEFEYKFDKDRFVIKIYKDENKYFIKVWDRWSRDFYLKNGIDEGILKCRTIVGVCDLPENRKEIKILDIIDEIKNELRNDFIKERTKVPKKKKKIEKKKVK